MVDALAYVFGHNLKGLTVKHVGYKSYDFIMIICIILDLNLYVIGILPLCSYFLGA